MMITTYALCLSLRSRNCLPTITATNIFYQIPRILEEKELDNKKAIAVRFLSSEKEPPHTMSSQSQNQSHKRLRNLSAPLHPPKAHITSLFYHA